MARPLNLRVLGVETGAVYDTMPNEPSTLDRTGAGWQYVTTYSNAKRIARRANRAEGNERNA
jgi:hypothetical protein